jgi:hypothetical protein
MSDDRIAQLRSLIEDAQSKPLNSGNIYESVRGLWAAVTLLTDELAGSAGDPIMCAGRIPLYT